MSIPARELEAFFRQNSKPDLADSASELAVEAKKLEDRNQGLLTAGQPQIELPKGIRSETLRTGVLRKEIMEQGGLAEAFKRRNIHVTSDAQYLIDQTEFTGLPDLELFWPSGRDLGLRQFSPYSRFTEAGQTAGYSLLRPEVGIYLRLQDVKQPSNTWYGVAMEPMVDRRRVPYVFGLGHDDRGLWLLASWTISEDQWSPGDRLAFGRSK